MLLLYLKRLRRLLPFASPGFRWFPALWLVFGPLFAMGEGSKELNANGGERAYLISAVSTLQGAYFLTQGHVRVYVNAGETIYLGSSAQGVRNGYTVLISPTGTVYENRASNGVGFIQNRAQEVAGPIAGGFTPYKRTAAAGESGVWSVFFVGARSNLNKYENEPDPISTTEDWDITLNPAAGNLGDNSGDIAAFDVSVSTSANASSLSQFIKGRAYMNVFQGNMGNHTGRFFGQFEVLTNDGYNYTVRGNGMAPYRFTFFSNNKGYKNADGSASYKSENSTSTANLHDPRIPDNANDITHKLFFNIPASDLPASAPIRTNTDGQASNTGTASTTWLKTSFVFPAITDFEFRGNEGTLNSSGTSMGSVISFTANQTGTYTITIDVNNNGVDASDVTLTGNATTGVNAVPWNGKNALGVAVNGTITASSITVKLKAGEVHFPFIDVENNPGGISIIRAGDNSSVIYWDDSSIPTSSGDTPSNPKTQLTGVNSSGAGSNGHTFGATTYNSNNFGDQVGLDTWAYLMSSTVVTSSPVLVRTADLQVVSVVSNKTSYCIGDAITYTVIFKNNGPDNITGATARFNFPAEITLSGAPSYSTSNVTVGTGSVTATSLSALLDMQSGGTATATITGTVTARPTGGQLLTSATILRPADVYDPDATNLDNAAPTDPQAECDAGTVGCNNIVSQSAAVPLSNISIATTATAAITEGNTVSSTKDMAFTVSLDAASTCQVTVNYALQHVTTNDSDFDFTTNPKTGTLTFSPGQTSKTITFAVRQDLTVEANETFSVQLSGANSAGQVSTATATGTVNNDDNIGTVTITATNGLEGTQNGVYTFSFPANLSFDVDTQIPFTLGTGSSTATGGGTDYTLSTSGSVTIPAGQNSVALTLNVTNDALIEGMETVEITPGTITNTYGTLTVNTPIPVLSIQDDDTATLTVSNASITEGDSGSQNLTFNVTLNNTLGSGFTINYATANGTAIAGEDYTARSGTLTFSGTAETQTVTVPVDGDLKIEANETFTLALSGLSINFGGLLSVAGSPATGTINDNDDTNANKTIHITSADGQEQGTVAASFTLAFPAGVSADQPTTVNFTLGGTATGATDYTNGSVTSAIIPAGLNSVSVSFPVIDDQVLEASESIIVTTGTVSNSNYTGITVDNSPHTVSILDNDSATLTIADTTVVEGNNGTTDLVFEVVLDKAVGSSFTVDFTVNDGTATLAGNDYLTPASTRLTFNTAGPFPKTRQIVIKVNGDQLLESNETLTVTLATPSNTFGGQLTVVGSPATGTITDDDHTPAAKVITISKADGFEGVANSKANFTFSLPAGVTVSGDTEITYTLAGTATGGGTDYTGATSGTITILAGANSVVLELPVVNDNDVEGSETVVVTVSGTTNTNPSFTGFSISNSGLALNIQDDENTVLLSGPSIITEGNSGTTVARYTVSLARSTSAGFSINYHTSNGTATAGEDYTAQTGTVNFVQNVANQSFTIDVVINGDLKIEADETFTLTLDGLSNTFGGTLNVSAPVTTTISDDDNTQTNRQIIISKTDGAEGGSHAKLTFSLPAGVTSESDTKITYLLSGTAVDGGVDYEDDGAGTAIIPANQNTITLTLTVNNDRIIEGTETVIVSIDKVENVTVPAMAAANSPQSLNILDNDNVTPAEIKLSKNSDGSETPVSAQFQVSFPTTLRASAPTTVKYSIAGTALNGTDYITILDSVIIPARQQSATIDINVINDRVIEGTETVQLTLISANTSVGTLTVNSDPETADITDNDNNAPNRTITLEKVSDGNEPGTNPQFRVRFPIISGVGITSAADATIRFTVNGTATDGADYTAFPAAPFVTIPAGNNSALIDIPVLDDNLIEVTETVSLTLNSTGWTFSLGTLSMATTSAVSANINDDDNTAANNHITLARVSDGAEPSTNGQFTVSYPATYTSSIATQVSYSISGSAVNGTDYTTLSGTVTIPALSNSATINVVVTNDQIIEITETVSLTLTGATATGFTLTAGNTPATINIADDDNTPPQNIVISLSKVSDGSEPGTNPRFKVGFPTSITNSVTTTVTYTASGTATAGTDYVTLPGTITIPANTNSVFIDVVVNDDNAIEGAETVALTLNSASSMIISTISTSPGAAVVATIADNDATPANSILTLTRENNGAEPGTDPRFKLAYPTGVTSGQPTTVTYTVSGSATGGADYTALTGQVVIPANSNSVDIDVQVTDDLVVEGTETVGITLTAADNTVAALTFTSTLVGANIDDNDNIPPNNVVTLAWVAHGAEPSTSARFSVSFPPGVTSSVPTTVSFTGGGTATPVADYTLPTSITIPANTNQAIISLPVIDDKVLELIETVELTLTGATNTVSTIAVAGGTVSANIDDDDNVAANQHIYITKLRDGVEGGTNPQFEVSFLPGYTSAVATTVNYLVAVQPASATAGADYTPLSGTVIIPANSSSVVIDVIVTNDLVIEPTETVDIELDRATNSVVPGLVMDAGIVSATIADDDHTAVTTTIRLDRVNHGAEPGTNPRFSVSFPAGYSSSVATTVTYSVSGTATSGADFAALSGTVTIPATANAADIEVTVINDLVIEGLENVQLTLIGASDLLATSLSTTGGTVSADIVDDDNTAANRTLTITKTDGAEGGTAGTFTFSLPAGVTLDEDLILPFTLSGTASNGTDYTPSSASSLTLTAGQSAVTRTLNITDDAVIEDGETVSLAAGSISSGHGTFTIDPASTSTLSIADNDQAILTLNQPAAIREGAAGTTATISFTVTLDKATASSFSIPYQTADGTAKAGEDYTATAGTLNFNGTAGESVTISVPVTGDGKIEPDEAFTLNLGAPTLTFGGRLTVNGTPGTSTILDDDNTLANRMLTITKADGAEGGAAGTFMFSLPAGVTLDEDISIPLTLAGTGINGTDYIPSSISSVTLAAGQSKVTLTLNVTDDAVIEDGELVSLVAGTIASSHGAFTIDPASISTLSIADNDQAILTFNQPAAIREGAAGATATISFTVTLDKATASSFSIPYQTADGTAKAGEDYTATAGTLNFNGTAGESVTISVSITGDGKIEPDEAFTLNLGTPNLTFGGRLTVSGSPATGTILDDDNIPANRVITITKTNGAEGGTAGTFTFSLPAGVTLNEDLILPFILSGTASNGTDYTPSFASSATLAAGQNTVALTLTVTDDAVVEDRETVSIIAGTIAGNHGAFTIHAASVLTLNIADNDDARVILAGPATVSEGNEGIKTVSFTVTLDKQTAAAFDINYATADGTAREADNDYTATSGTAHFAGNAGESHTISIAIHGDKKIERDESISLNLSGLSRNFSGRLSVPSAQAAVTILSDDQAAISISSSNGVEGGAPVSFTVGFSDPAVTADVPVILSYSLSGTAAADYTRPADRTLTLPANTNSIRIDLPVIDDRIVEGMETVVITLDQSAALPLGIQVATASRTGEIEDNDTAVLGIANATVREGNEGTRTLSFNVILSGETASPFTIPYRTAAGTATEEIDYQAKAGVLTFSGVEDQSQTIVVTVNSDRIIERNELFRLVFGAPSETFGGRLTVPSSQAAGTIENDDETGIVLSKISDGAEPAASPRFRVSFRDSLVTSSEPLEIAYSISGTATNGTDYTALSGLLTLTAGAHEAIITAAVINDRIMELPETVVLAVTSARFASFTLPVDASPASATIVDDDLAQVTVSKPVIREGNTGTSVATFKLTLNAGTPTGFTLRYATADGTATIADNDYLATSGTFTFAGRAEETYAVEVPVKGDLRIERDETFSLLTTLSDSFNGRLTISESPAVATILDDDNTPSNKVILISASADGTEGSTNGSVTFSFPPGITIDAPTTLAFTVGGTATNGVDYILFADPVTIPAGVNQVTLPVLVKDDIVVEGTETVIVMPGSISNTLYTGISIASPVPPFNIIDNDEALLTVNNPSVREGNTGDTELHFQVKLSTATQRPFTVSYAVEDGTATLADQDYRPAGGTITFAGIAGEVVTVPVAVRGDIHVESDETVWLKLSAPSLTFDGRLRLPAVAASGNSLNDDIAPIATDDQPATGEDKPVVVAVTTNDYDPDGSIDDRTVALQTIPRHGTVVKNSEGVFIYTPAKNFSGTDNFSYTVKDNAGIVSNVAQVSLLVNPENDPPVAADDAFYVVKNGTLAARVSLNDTDVDGDALRFSAIAAPANGRIVTFDQATGAFVYVPATGFTGIDRFTYRACDAGGLCDVAEVVLYVQPKVTVSLSPATVTITEGDRTTVTARLTEPLLQDIKITLAYSGTALRGVDYSLGDDSLVIVIPAGKLSTTQKVTVTTRKDYLKENTQLLRIAVNSADPAAFVTIGKGAEISIDDFYPEDKGIEPGANGEINPDPLCSPNGDGIGNEQFIIHNIERYPDNEVTIYNRWGNEVFRIKGYNNHDRAFAGRANTGLVVNKDAELVDGVYFFIIYSKDKKGERKMNRGSLIIKR